jgi:hypothetical protein
MRVHRAEPGPLAHGLHPAVGGTAIQTAAVLAHQDGTFPSFPDGQIDGASGARHQGNERRFGALADDMEHPMPPFHAQVLDVGVARLGDPQAVQAQ